MINKNNFCINCHNFQIYQGAEQFADLGNLCIHCFYELKLANLRRELANTIENSTAAIERAVAGLEEATATIELLKTKLEEAGISYSALLDDFITYINPVSKPVIKPKRKMGDENEK